MGREKKPTNCRFGELHCDKYFSHMGRLYRKDWREGAGGVVSFGVDLVTGKAFHVDSTALVARRKATLEYKDHRIRTVTEGGKRYFVLKDVCRALGVKNHRETFRKWKKNAKGVTSNYSLCEFSSHGGDQRVIIVAKDEALAIVGRSRKPNAHALHAWIRENT